MVRSTLETSKDLTEVSKMAARNDAFVKPCFELLRKNPPTLSFLRVGGCGRNGEAAENRGFAGSMDIPYEKILSFVHFIDSKEIRAEE